MICIKRHYPFVSKWQILQAPVPLLGMALKDMRDNMAIISLSNKRCIVGAVRIDEKYFVGPINYAPKTMFYISFFVVGKNHN